MKRRLAWVVMLVLAASPSLAEEEKGKLPGKKGAEEIGPLNNPELMKRLQQKFDTNKDGILSADERAKMQEELLKQAAQTGGPAFQQFLKKFDADGDGQLNNRERQAALQAAQKLKQKGGGGPQVGAPLLGGGGNDIPADILEKFDKDGDGKLNNDELADANKSLSGKRQRVKKADVIKEFDKDGDGKLNEEERAAAKAAARERKKKAD